MKDIKSKVEQIIKEISFVLAEIDEDGANSLMEEILKANYIVVAGAGRVGMAVRGFAMRLGHLGFRAYAVGDATVPGVGKGDLFIACSGSGETQTVYALVERVKKDAARVTLITGDPKSRMGRLADSMVVIKAPSKTKPVDGFQSAQPMTTLNEQCLGIFFDALVLRLMEKMEETHETMWARHSNLE